ncbi:MAG: hypothetical protein Q4D19_03545 [Lautropia sp.]|nr:hypothetical protein [Lautropia sp.]
MRLAGGSVLSATAVEVLAADVPCALAGALVLSVAGMEDGMDATAFVAAGAVVDVAVTAGVVADAVCEDATAVVVAVWGRGELAAASLPAKNSAGQSASAGRHADAMPRAERCGLCGCIDLVFTIFMWKTPFNPV